MSEENAPFDGSEVSIKLQALFDQAASLPDACAPGYMQVSTPLYKSYLRLYWWNINLCQKLDAIIKDGEHRLCMDEGLEHGWNLPHPDFMRKETDALKDFLDQIDPFSSHPKPNGKTRMRVDLALQMSLMTEIDRHITRQLFNMFRQTQYLDYHRHLKEKALLMPALNP